MSAGAVVFGAGKIARGFIAHLLSLSDVLPIFVECRRDLVDLLRERQSYRIRVLGAPEKVVAVTRFRVFHTSETEAVAVSVAGAVAAFTAVGGPSLPSLGPLLAEGLRQRFEGRGAPPLNVFLCENYHQPARLLRDAVLAALPAEHQGCSSRVGFVECQVLRSCIDAEPEALAASPLELKVQDEGRLPCDADAVLEPRPEIRGLVFIPRFGASLVRKLFTYNASNAAIAYLGHRAGYKLLADAATDPEISRVAAGVCEEAGRALISRYGFDAAEQAEFAAAALAKYRNAAIVDPIERNARDPLRKLSRHDRLVGPAALCLEEGVNPEHLVTAILAAFRYDEPGDPAARRLQTILRERGLGAVLKEVCGLEEGHRLSAIIEKRWHGEGASPA